MQVLITELKTISDIIFSNTTRYARHNSLVDLLATKSHFFVSRDKRDLLWKHIATARLFPQTKHFDDLIFQVFNLSFRTLSWVSPLLMICFLNNILKKKCFEMNKSWIFCENTSIATAWLFPKQRSVLMTSFFKFSICHLASISVGQSFIIVYSKSPFDLFLYTFMMKNYNMILEWTRHWSWSALVSAAFLVWLNLKTSFRISMGCQFVLMSSGEASYFELSINGKCLRNVAECCWYRVIK